MNGDGEDVVAQERRIWQLQHGDDRLIISLVDAQDRQFTFSELRDFIERHFQNGTNDTIVKELEISRLGAHPTEQECTLLGRSCQPLAHHLQNLSITGRGWTDLETSCILRHMSLQSSTIQCFLMGGSDGGMSLSIRTLCDDFPSTLQILELHHVVFTSVDCQLLGQMISNKEHVLDDLYFSQCSFPCLVDFLTLIAGFVKDKISSDRCGFLDCTVKDASIPNQDGADYLELGRIFCVFWMWRHGESEARSCDQRLQKSWNDLLNYFRPMQQAGLSRLLLPPPSQNSDNACCGIETSQPRERWEWVNVLGHEAVIDRVDLLFHILLLNPEVCVLD